MSDVSFAKSPKWAQYVFMYGNQCPPCFYTVLFLIAALPFIAVATIVWFIHPDTVSVALALLAALLLIGTLYYRWVLKGTKAQLAAAKKYRFRLEEKYADIKHHPDLPNTIRKEHGLPERDKNGYSIINGKPFVPASVLDIDLNEPAADEPDLIPPFLHLRPVVS